MLSGVDSFISSELTTVKILFLIPSLSFQTFIVCYLFGNLHSRVILNALLVLIL